MHESTGCGIGEEASVELARGHVLAYMHESGRSEAEFIVLLPRTAKPARCA